jgi:disulfide bond formation protein DsbB
MGDLFKNITDQFFPTLGRWQERRPLWLLGGLWALGMELFSVLYFQLYLEMFPCEYCVKIRLSMIIIFIGAMVAAINPRCLILKVVGYGTTLCSAFWGLIMSGILETINIKTLYTPGWFPPCSAGFVKFPMGLKLDEWLPKHFNPEGTCGEDSQWLLMGFSMTQWLMLVYMAMIIGLILMLSSWILAAARAKSSGSLKPLD